MQQRDFVFWLQGLFELHPEVLRAGLSIEQTKIVKQHLELVFKHDADIDQAACEHVTLPDGQKQQPMPRPKRGKRDKLEPTVPARPRIFPNSPEPWRLHDFPDHPRNRPIAIC